MCGEIKICVCLEMWNVKWNEGRKKCINNEFCWILMVSGLFLLVLKDRIFAMEIKMEIDGKV